MQRDCEFEIIIYGIIDFFCKLLNIKPLSWDFIKFTKNDSKEIKQNFTSLFDFDKKCIYINPNFKRNLRKEYKHEDEEFIIGLISSKIAHECRHGYQLEHQDEFEIVKYFEALKNNKNIINSDIEIDANAFEQAVLWLVFGSNDLKIKFDESIENEVQELATKLYNEYSIKFHNMVLNH